MLEADVAIIGGGVSGAAAALTLLRYTQRKVVLVERSCYAKQRVGESVSPSISPLLTYLGIPECLDQCFSIRSHANAAAWGSDQLVSREHLFTGRGDGWQLNRGAFDLYLADKALADGATTFRNTRLRSIASGEHGGWILSLEGDCTAPIRATQVIDASGRAATFSRMIGANRRTADSLIGVAMYVEGLREKETPHSTVVEAEEFGWWYAALLPRGNAIVMFMTDPSLVKPLGVDEGVAFHARAMNTKYISSLMANGRPLDGLHIHSASSQRLSPVTGEGWLAVGDAAMACDPLSSLGIGHALSSGIQGARIVDELLGGDSELANAYPNDVARIWEEYFARRTGIYEAEQRWPTSTFWRKRHTFRAIC